jgi:hypothetical protein
MVTKKITEGGEGLLEMYGEQCGHAGRYWRCPICERAAISQAVSEAVRAERECASVPCTCWLLPKSTGGVSA